jgi:hypothetical protein
LPEEQTYFPSRNAQEAIFVDGLDPVISERLGEKLVAATGNSHGKFLLALAGEQGKGGSTLTDVTGRGSCICLKVKTASQAVTFTVIKRLKVIQPPLIKSN